MLYKKESIQRNKFKNFLIGTQCFAKHLYIENCRERNIAYKKVVMNARNEMDKSKVGRTMIMDKEPFKTE